MSSRADGVLMTYSKQSLLLHCSALHISINESFLLFLQDKAGSHKNIYPYILQEIRPTLDELGISTPEELGLDKPDASKLV